MIRRIVEQKDIQYVILDKIDRFARNRRDDANILFELHSAGAKVISVKENIDDTPGGKLMHGILATLAEYISSNNGTEALKGMTQKAQVGGTPGRAPIGYLNHREQIPGSPRGRATVVVDPDRAPLIVWAFEQYVSGEWTVAELTDALDAKGLRTVPTRKRSAKPVPRSSVARMLSNRYYIGTVTFRGVQHEGRHEPIVDPQLFEQVQKVLEGKATIGEKFRRHNHYLRGSVFCGECKSKLVFSQNRGRGGVYDYFKCMNGGTSGSESCPISYARADWLEYKVEQHWPDNIINTETADLLRAVVKEELVRDSGAATEEFDRQTKRVKDLTEERTTLLRAHLSGAVPIDLLKSEQNRIAAEITQAKTALDAVSLETDQIEATLTKACELAHNCDQTYLNASPTGRQRLNQIFFDRIEVHQRDKIRFELNSPFKELVGLIGDAGPETAQKLRNNNNQQETGTTITANNCTSANRGKKETTPGRGWNLDYLVPPLGFEPRTNGLKVRCANQAAPQGRNENTAVMGRTDPNYAIDLVSIRVTGLQTDAGGNKLVDWG